MIKGSFINNKLFRIFTPLIYGVLVYIIVLLFFDSIEKLFVNFFSFEVLICIFITYFVFEAMRFISNLLDKKFIKITRMQYRIALQTGLTISAVFIVTSSILVLYYKYLVGFNRFTTELMVFNTIYIFTCVFYNILYFSIVYLNLTNEVKFRSESQLKQSIEGELEEYRSRINPDLLFSCLETGIVLIRNDITIASEFIQKLSDVYRYILSGKRNEPIELCKELEITEKLINILNIRNSNSIKLEIISKDYNPDKKVIPGTLHIVIEEFIHSNIVSELQPLILNCNITCDSMVIQCNGLKRLTKIKTYYNELENLRKSYLAFSEETIKVTNAGDITTISIPLID